jgi:BirA family biotin operon repressor/biotin-[acetyl-CoA-carboxylase] ligase
MIKTNSDISIFSYQEIDSTNDESKRLLDNQKMPPYWVIADKQTAGRGRKNRFWDSPSGNFMGTYVLNISGKKRILPQLSFVSALAIYDTIIEFKPKNSSAIIMLKWPNDIIINDKKCGGILIENIFSENNLLHTIAIGIGVNLSNSPLHTTFPSGNVLKELNIDIKRDTFLTAINNNILKLLTIWNTGKNYKEILSSWKSVAYLINKEILVSLPNGDKQAGIFSSIDDEGGLVLLNNKGKKDIFYAAEIFEGL